MNKTPAKTLKIATVRAAFSIRLLVVASAIMSKANPHSTVTLSANTKFSKSIIPVMAKSTWKPEAKNALLPKML